jgi:hypothetical protein
MEQHSLSSLLLGRLPAPVVRIDFRNLQRRCFSSAATPTTPRSALRLLRPTTATTAEAELIQRCALRASMPVLSLLDRLWGAVQASDNDDIGTDDSSISKTAFARFHSHISHALLQHVDQRYAVIIADCEWALGGGKDRMSKGDFCEWIYDVLEGWATEGSQLSIPDLGDELLEAVRAHAQDPT